MTNRDDERSNGQGYGQGYGNERYGNQGYGRGYGQSYGQDWRGAGAYQYGEGPFGNWGPGYYGYGNQGYGNDRYGNQGWNQYGTRYGNPEWNQGYGMQRQGYGQGMGNQNWNQRGPFSGVGPQNYQRSDQRIQEDINDRLTEHPNLDARNVNVDVHNGEVTLNGWVNSRQDKRIADDIADAVTGVKNVSNNLSVQPSHQDQPGWMQSIENAFTPGSTPSSGRNQDQQTYGQQTTGTGTRR